MRIIDSFVWWAANASPKEVVIISVISLFIIYGIVKLPVPEKRTYKKRA
jgi:hypothetical protein